MAIEWTPDLAVGVAEIDTQHQELFRRIDALLDAMTQGRGRDEVERVLGFLSDYVGVHFRAEERQMALHAYPAMAAHKAEHGAFVTDMLALRDEFRAGGATVALTIELQRRVCDWLKNHIMRTDMALANFLRQQRR